MMASKWQKAKQALGLNLCLYTPQSGEESSPPSAIDRSRRLTDSVPLRFSSDSAAALFSPSGDDTRPSATPTQSSSGLRLTKSFSKSFKKTCAICLASIKPGQGHAIFTAECSHTFHFHCIALNVNHGSKKCPVCRAKWKEIPFQNPSTNLPNAKSRISPVDWSRDELALARRIPSPRLERQVSPPHASEPGIFDDDEVLDHQHEPIVENVARTGDPMNNSFGKIEVTMYPEVSAVPRAMIHNDFSVLINLKAPLNTEGQNGSRNENMKESTGTSRAPVDLVTVLDVSGSMAGTKLALLKRAMGFVIQNLGPSDRLSVVAFSSIARRLFPLRKMTEAGKQEAVQAVNSLSSNGGTNISDGLRKGAKVIVDRKLKNPVTSIILLSDGQDTYTVTSPSGGHPRADYKSLIPLAIHCNGATGFRIPVHAFGFGTDHAAAAMHAISELSGGTFSFIEDESVIQDAFAQCIGGLLSVVVQETYLKVECAHQNLRINSIKAGSYRTSMTDDARTATIHVGDLYADEERDFLVSVDVPADEMSLLKVRCFYKDPITSELMSLNEASEVKLERPTTVVEPVLSMDVDRQRNRIRAAEAMAEARLCAERGDLAGAVAVLESCGRVLTKTISARADDRLCVSLCAELKEMQERMATRHAYETSGRAYVLSGLSSHSWQRATARGDSTESTSLLQSYQTPTMIDMVTRSQTIILGTSSSQRKLRPAQSFPATRERR